MAETAADRMVPVPASGRVYTGTRRVRFGDVNAVGRPRLDALSTFVQDVAGDDTAESGLGAEVAWVVRRATFVVQTAPRVSELLELRTWCSGIGRRWAERRVSMRGDRGAVVEAAGLWVPLDPATHRPVPFSTAFLEGAAPAALGREVSSRLHHPSSPPDPSSPDPSSPDDVPLERRPWVLRATDFDLLGHVNNAAAWAMVEELLDEHDRRVPLRAEMEYRAPVEIGTTLELCVARPGPGAFSLWALGRPAGAEPGTPPTLHTTATVTPLPG